MLRKGLLMLAGASLALLGLIGLVVPVLPGLLLLLAAAGCFSMASPRLKASLEGRLDRHPRYRSARRRWRLARALAPWQRVQLAFWLTLGSLLPSERR